MDTKTSGVAATLRAIADWYDEHPDMPGPHSLDVSSVPDEKSVAVMVAQALGTCTKEYTESVLTLARDFGGIRLRFLFWRTAVCDRRVVGTVEVPEQVTPAYTREIVEWDCHSLLKAEEG